MLLIVPVASEKLRAFPEIVSRRLAPEVALPLPPRVKVPNSNGEAMSQLAVCKDGVAVLSRTVVPAVSKNTMVLALSLTGTASQVAVDQLTGVVGVPVTLEG